MYPTFQTLPHCSLAACNVSLLIYKPTLSCCCCCCFTIASQQVPKLTPANHSGKCFPKLSVASLGYAAIAASHLTAFTAPALEAGQVYAIYTSLQAILEVN